MISEECELWLRIDFDVVERVDWLVAGSCMIAIDQSRLEPGVMS